MPGGSIVGRGWERGLEIEREVGTEGSSWSLSGNWDEEVEMRSWSAGEDGNRTRAAWRVTDKLGGETKISVCNHLNRHFYRREASTRGPWPLWEGGTLPDFSTEIQPRFLGLLLLANCCRLPGQSASSPPSPYKKNDPFPLQPVVLLPQGAEGREDSGDVGLAEEKPPPLIPVCVDTAKLFPVMWRSWEI